MLEAIRSLNWSLLISIAGFGLALLSFLNSYFVTVATQRAFVSISSFDNSIVNGNLVVFPVWQNSGGTPTSRMRNYINWKYFESGVPANYDFPDLDEKGAPTLLPATQPMFIAPKGTLLAHRTVIETAYLNAVANGAGELLIWGWAEYDDVFPLTRRHRTNFANRIVVTKIATNDQKQVTAGIEYPQFPRHNCVDGECN